jgi:PilZ domain
VSTIPDRTERRHGPRVNLLSEFQGHLVALDEEVRVLQLGPGGLTMAAAIPLQVDHRYDLQLTLGERSITVGARVVHMRTTIDRDEFTYIVGMQFADLPADAAEAIGAFIARNDVPAEGSDSAH